MTTPAGARSRVLVVDDDIELARTLVDGLAERGLDGVACASSRQALDLLRDEAFDALVTDLRMPEVDGLGLLAASRRLAPDRPVIVMTAYSAVESAVESIRQGAHHYVTKPFKLDELAIFLARALDETRVRREAANLRRTLHDRYSRQAVAGQSAAMRAVLDVVERVADSDAPVLILGETGSGKSLLARVIHADSRRASGPFVAVNCAALPETLLESELFGHVRGAFTGAVANRPGLFAEARGGTLFLDEIGEMSPALQAKLLHVLEHATARPVGGTGEVAVDVRVLAATHRDLRERVRAGAFREDLLYRLDVVSVEAPPLRHRRDDIPDLIDTFLAEARTRHPASPVVRLAPATLQRLMDYDWPGNVRELQHAVERLVLLGREADAPPSDLPPSLAGGAAPAPAFSGAVLPIRELQRRYAAWALEQNGGHKARTAEQLGVDVKTLSKWLSGEAPAEPTP